MNTLFEFKTFDIERLIGLLEDHKEFLYMESSSQDHYWENMKLNIPHIREISAKYARFSFSFMKENKDEISFNVKQTGTRVGTVDEKDYNDSLFPLIMKYADLSELRYATRNMGKYIIFSTPNADNMNYWEYKDIPIPQPMVYIPEFSFTDPNYKILSLEHIPSHAHYMGQDEGDKLIFEACWQMYFGDIYYKYIPKPLFDTFTDCEENVILEHGIRRITLYKDPEDFGKPNATARQWAFRRQLGIDSIGHELTYNKNRIEPENLPVLITKKNCIKGQTKVTRFLDKNYQLINSDKATYKEIKEYLDDGITVVFEEIVDL